MGCLRRKPVGSEGQGERVEEAVNFCRRGRRKNPRRTRGNTIKEKEERENFSSNTLLPKNRRKTSCPLQGV